MNRADRSRLTEWWFTVDWALLAAIVALLIIGLVLSLSASPAVAVNKGLEPFYFFQRQATCAGLAVVLLFGLSLMPPGALRRLAGVGLLAGVAALVFVTFFGTEVNGARRWVFVGGLSVQPMEFVKPLFVVSIAWLFAEAQRRPDMPALPLAVLAGGAVAGLAVVQPDVGHALLIAFVWGVVYVLAGQPLSGAFALAGLAGAGLVGAYFAFAHVRGRIDQFLAPEPVANSQIDRAMQSFIEGGFFGRGPGEGTIKVRLPDAHTDFIYAVIAEEYGVLACLLVLSLFAFIVIRAFTRAFDESDLANRLAVQGLAVMFGAQALINMGVNVGLLPAKGMTLPYISAGGSSHVGTSLALGLLLALTRRRAGELRFLDPLPGSAVDGHDLSDGAGVFSDGAVDVTTRP